MFSNDRAWRSAIDVERTVGWEDFVLMDAIENSSPVSKNADLHCNGLAFVRKKGDIDLRDDCGGGCLESGCPFLDRCRSRQKMLKAENSKNIGSGVKLMRKLAVLLSLLLSNSFTPSPANPSSEDFAKTTCDAVSHRSTKQGERPGKVSAVLSPQNTSKHIGDYVTVKFVVDNVHACRKGHVYLNETRDYKTCFAAIISAASRKFFPADADKAYKGKTVAVTGTLEMYGGTPKIVLDKPEQLLVE